MNIRTLYYQMAVTLTILSVNAFTASAYAIDWFGQTLDGKVGEDNSQGFGPYDYFDINEASDRQYQEGRH